MSSRFLDWLLSPLFRFAGECFRAEYATGRDTASYSGDLETAQAIALGGASLAQEFRGDRSGPRNLDGESFFHARSNATGGQRKNVS